MKKDDLLLKVFQELSTVRDNHRLLVLVTNGFLEILINALIKEKLKMGKRISDLPNYAIKILFIYETNLINDELFKGLETIRKIRNRAAHEPIFQLEPTDLSDLPKEFQNPKKFYDACINIVGAFWNKYPTFFQSKFST